MRRSLKSRCHVFHIFIFGFFILALYWYDQAIINNISSVIIRHTKSGKNWTDDRYIGDTTLIRDLHLSNNSETLFHALKTVPGDLLEMNITAISNSGSRSRPTFPSTSELLQHSVATSRTDPTSSSAPQTQHSTNASTNFFSNNPIYQSFTTSGTNSTVISESDTIRAIYQSGHSVTAQGKCPNYGEDMDLVIVITSAPSHTEARTAIRKSWGLLGQRTNVSVVFILGMTGDPKLESSLQREQKLYGDIIRGQFLDSYFNLTLKTVSMLEWIDTYCPRAKFILKTDDDVFINMPRLLSFVKKHETDRNVVFGKLARKWRPFRDPKSKYFVPWNKYKNMLYPNFMSGPAYLLSSDVINKLYKTALNENFFKLEDVFITGIVASKLQINLTRAFEFLNVKVAYSPCNVQRVISIHEVEPRDQARLWKMLSDTKTNCILT